MVDNPAHGEGGRIPYIGVSYSELRDMNLAQLEVRIGASLAPYIVGICSMGIEELVALRDSVKDARKYGFRFAHDKTDGIEKVRIQLALSGLARLFRLANDRIAGLH